MAVLGRLLISSAERLDLPDLLSIESYSAGDWQYFMKSLIGDSKPYVLKGFEVIDPNNAIGSRSCSIKVSDSVVFYPGSSAGPFFYGLPDGNTLSTPLVPDLRQNAVNYVYLTLSTVNTSVDTRAFWDPDKDGGAGGEFTQDVNTESVLTVDINVSTGSFPTNTIPVAIITLDGSIIKSIQDARDMMFRLGSGGLSPNPFNAYTWRSLPTDDYQRSEPSTIMSNSSDPNPFQGADKNINTLKEWMDAVMSKIRELGGSAYWYDDTSSYSLITNFIDAMSTTIKSKGRWTHDSITQGLVNWTDDINIKITSDSRNYIIRGPGSALLNNEQVLYVPLSRNLLINSSDESVQWYNGQIYVNTVGGALGLFANLNIGDYIKKIDDTNDKFVRIEQFYENLNGSGTIASSPANARSIKLSAAYTGADGIKQGRYDKGSYATTDLQVADRTDSAISSYGANFHWLALRSDNVQTISNIVSTNLTINLSDGDGKTVKVTSSSNHGLIDGDRINIVGSINYDGTYVVEVEASDIFYINSSITIDESNAQAHYATVTTTNRQTTSGFELESAKHGLNSNDTVNITNTVNYNGSYLVNVRDSVTYTIPINTAFSTEIFGYSVCTKILVKSNGTTVDLVQGGNVNIDSNISDSVLSYIGMKSLAQNNPIYEVPNDANTLNGMANYGSALNEDLTLRVARLTAMMADKAQDKTIKFTGSGYLSTTNTISGGNATISFNSEVYGTPRLDIVLPSSDNITDNYVNLTSTITLSTYQAAYIVLDRNNAFPNTSVTICDIKKVPLTENIFIVAVRLGTNDVWLWDALHIPGNKTVSTNWYADEIIQQNLNLKLVRGGNWTWNFASNTLVNDSDAYIQVPGLNENVNTISAQSISLTSDGQVAYVKINRVQPPSISPLIVYVDSINNITLNDSLLIIARRIDNKVQVGNDGMLLLAGESKPLNFDSRPIKVKAISLIASSLPTGALPLSIDGISVTDGDKVLFTNSMLNGVYVLSGSGTTWTKLDVFDGSLTPYAGVLIESQDNTGFSPVWTYDGMHWKPTDVSSITSEPTGFPNRTASSISFNDLTRTFSIAPTSNWFDIYQQGVPYRFASTVSTTIPNNEGLHYIYFNNGALFATQTYTISMIKQFVFVATIQWDAADSKHIMLGDERHGLVMDSDTHAYLHTSVGTRYISGLSAGNFTLVGDGSLDAHAELSISDGTINDEDIAMNIANSSSPSLPFEQILSPIAKIPVYYRTGTNGDWRKLTSTNFPVKPGTSRIQWNQYDGTTWSTVDASNNNKYIATWLFATNNQEEPVIAILGQLQSNTLNDAQSNNLYQSISFGSLPSLEMKVLYRLIYQTSTSFSNSVHAALVDVTDLRRAVDVSLGTYAPGDHGLLTGLTDTDHPDYAIYVNQPAAYTGALKQINTTDNTNVQLALQSLDKFFAQLRIYPHPTNNKRVKISGANSTLTNNTTLTQTIRNLMMSFNGAEIDFSTGSVYQSDGVTSLGINFTPATIPSNQFFWYSVGIKALSPVNADNTINIQLIVNPASSSSASLSAAPKAKYKGTMPLGQVYVQQSGTSIAAITAANIYQLNSNSSGSTEIVEFTLNNNQIVAANITDFQVDALDSKIFKAEYSITRRYSPSIEYMTQGSFTGIYRPSTSLWSINGDTYTGDDPEVVMSISTAGTVGQVQYVSSNLTGTQLESIIRFKITQL